MRAARRGAARARPRRRRGGRSWLRDGHRPGLVAEASDVPVDRLHRARRHVAGDERRRRATPSSTSTTTAATSSCLTIHRPSCGPPTIRRSAARIGDDIVTASGTTLLGADDKAGVAEIMAAVEYLLEHPRSRTARSGSASPRTRRSAGARTTSTSQRFGASCAYTLDGGSRGELEYESFSADLFTVTFKGFNTHPGYARGRMVNCDPRRRRFHRLAAARRDDAGNDRWR